MAWDANKHRTIKVATVDISESAAIEIERYSYDNGPEKIKLGKIIKRASGIVNHAPFSGVDVEHAEKVGNAILAMARGACS
jgi:hypothetical protein